MDYRLINIETLQSLAMTEDGWISLIESARAHGWVPKGTIYDFSFQIDEECDGAAGWMMNLFVMLQLHMERASWDGNYLERKNQIVLLEDASLMAECLAEAGTPVEITGFLSLGAFRIYAG